MRKNHLTPKTFSAFVDLVATKEIAQHDIDKYYEHLTSFKEDVIDQLRKIESELYFKVYFFSDCAYIESESLETLLAFLIGLRSSLLKSGSFFKAALTCGSLDPQSVSEDEYFEKNSKLGRLLKKRLSGYYFNTKAAKLFEQQEILKGIGINVANDVAAECSSKVKETYLCTSCYVDQATSRKISIYTDIKLDKNDMKQSVWDNFIPTFFHAKGESKRFGRYYISFLVLWINSLDLSNCEFTEEDRIDGNSKLEYFPSKLEDVSPSKNHTVVDAIFSRSFSSLFGDVPGIECVYAALISRILISVKDSDDSLFRSCRSAIKQLPARFLNWDYVPINVASKEARQKLRDIVVDGVLSRP